MLKTMLFSSSLLLSSLAIATGNNLIADYLDTTATGSALKVGMSQASLDGYNMVIFGFAKITVTDIDFYHTNTTTTLDTQDVTAQMLAELKKINQQAKYDLWLAEKNAANLK